MSHRAAHGKQLDKGLACDSRWFDTTLPAELLYYACCDAYAGLEVYHVLVPTTVPLFGVALAAQTAGEARAGEARAQDEAAGEALEAAPAQTAEDRAVLEQAQRVVSQTTSPPTEAAQNCMYNAACEMLTTFAHAHSDGATRELQLPHYLVGSERGRLKDFCSTLGNLTAETAQTEDEGRVLLVKHNGAAAVAGTGTATHVRSEAELRADEDRTELPDVVLESDQLALQYDALHFIGVNLKVVRTKDTPAHGMFAHALGMCLFRPMTGERDRILNYLCTKPTNSGKTRAQVAAETSWAYFRKHSRMVCPAPIVIMRSLVQLYNVFSRIKNPKDDAPFFHSGWRAILQKELAYVAKGFLSDRPGICYYIALPCKAGQLQKYRCARGSSALEGYHKHLRLVAEHLVAATHEYTDAIINEFDLRWNMRAARHIGLDQTGVEHYDVAVIEANHDVRRAIFGAGLKSYAPLLKVPPVIHHGVHFSQQAWSQKCEQARAKVGVLSSTTAPPALHDTATREDTGALLNFVVASGTPGAAVPPYGLADLALSRGLLFSEGEAQTWLDNMRNREHVLYQMHGAGFVDLIAQLPPLEGTVQQSAHEAATEQVQQHSTADEAALQGPAIGHQRSSAPVLLARQPQLQAPAAGPGNSPGNSDSCDEAGSEARAGAPASSVGDVIAVGVLAAAAPDVTASGQKRKRRTEGLSVTKQRRRCFEAGQKEGGDPEACCRKGARPGGSRLVYIPCEKHE